MWKLEKAAYGLGDALRHWYFSVRDHLISFDCKQSEIDKALFRWYQDDQLKGIFLMHVDYFMFAGTDQCFRNVIDKITNKYKIGKLKNRSLRMLDQRWMNLAVELGSVRINIFQR